MNGRAWTNHDSEVLRVMAGSVPYAAIAKVTGHAESTIRSHAKAMGLPSYISGRQQWTRRQWLMADAAGLDFQIAGCR